MFNYDNIVKSKAKAGICVDGEWIHDRDRNPLLRRELFLNFVYRTTDRTTFIPLMYLDILDTSKVETFDTEYGSAEGMSLNDALDNGANIKEEFKQRWVMSR